MFSLGTLVDVDVAGAIALVAVLGVVGYASFHVDSVLQPSNFGVKKLGVQVPSRPVDVPVYVSILPSPGAAAEARGDNMRNELQRVQGGGDLHVLDGVWGITRDQSTGEAIPGDHREVLEMLSQGFDSLPLWTQPGFPHGYKYEEVKGKSEEYMHGYWGAVGCTLSHLKLIAAAYDSGEEMALIAEDDLDFQTTKFWTKSLSQYAAGLPQGWSLVQTATSLSAPLMREIAVQWRQSEHRGTFTVGPHVMGAWGTMAMLISRKGMKEILDSYRRADGKFHLRDATCLEADVCLYYEAVKEYYTSYPPLLLAYEKFESTHGGASDAYTDKLDSIYEEGLQWLVGAWGISIWHLTRPSKTLACAAHFKISDYACASSFQYFHVMGLNWLIF